MSNNVLPMSKLTSFQIVYAARGSNKSWNWLSMVTRCIFTLRDLMMKVQNMFQIPSHGSRHTSPDDRKEVENLMTYFRENKLLEFVANRPGNDVVEPTRDLMVEGAKKANKPSALRNFQGYKYK